MAKKEQPLWKIHKPLWKNNTICPQCGNTIKDPKEFVCCEFGNSYCSDKCASIYVNANWPETEGEKQEREDLERWEYFELTFQKITDWM